MDAVLNNLKMAFTGFGAVDVLEILLFTLLFYYVFSISFIAFVWRDVYLYQ